MWMVNDEDEGLVGVGDDVTVDVLIDLRGEPHEAHDGLDPCEWVYTFTHLPVPEGTSGRVWKCESVDDSGIVWESADGFRGALILPNYGDDMTGWKPFEDAAFELFPALVWSDTVHDGIEMTAQAATQALTGLTTHARHLAHTAHTTHTAHDSDPCDAPSGPPHGWADGRAVLTSLGIAGAAVVAADVPPVLLDRYGCRVGLHVYAWTARGFSLDDIIECGQWFDDTEDELLVWANVAGVPGKSLIDWLDGNEPLLHGLDKRFVTACFVAWCTDGYPASPAEIRSAHHYGVRHPAWQEVINTGHDREFPFTTDPTTNAIIENTFTLDDYTRAWVEIMPISHAVWFIAHGVALADAVATYDPGTFTPTTFQTLWALTDPEYDQEYLRGAAATAPIPCTHPITA